jgi:predicted transcriptional regulator
VLSILEQKGLLTHIVEGKKYLYSPTIAHEKAMHSAVRQLMNTYFDGSLEKAVTAILEIHNEDITDEELKTLAEIIERVRREDEEKDVTNDT